MVSVPREMRPPQPDKQDLAENLAFKEDLENEWSESVMTLHFDSDKSGLPSNIDIDVRVISPPESGKEEEKQPETILVLGGVGEDMEVMKPLAMALVARGKQVIAIDMPGYGKSSDADVNWRVGPDKKDKKDFGDYSNLLVQILFSLRTGDKAGTEQGIGDKITVIGHSLGGAIATDFVKRNREQVGSLVLLSPAGNKKNKVISGVRIPPKGLAEFVARHVQETWLKRIKSSWFGGEKDLPPIVRNMWLKNFAGKSKNWLGDVNSERRLIQRFWEAMVVVQGRLDQDLEKILDGDVPVTLMVGDQDKLFLAKDYEDLNSALGSRMDLQVIKGVGHYGPVENSGAFANQI